MPLRRCSWMRPGADHHVRAVLQRSHLRAVGDAAAEGQDLDVVGGAGQPADLLATWSASSRVGHSTSAWQPK